MSAFRRFLLRLLTFQMAGHFATSAVVAALAPRLLLLEPRVIDELVPLGLVLVVLVATAIAVGTFAALEGLRPLFAALDTGDEEVSPLAVLALQHLPARLTVAYALEVLAFLALSAFFRPDGTDAATHVALAVLVLTIVCGIGLTSFTMMRATVSEVMAQIPHTVARDAFELFRAGKPSVRRVRRRVLVSVVAPATFVALGASLLAYAHARAADTQARAANALAFARATLEPLEDEVIPTRDITLAAETHGYRLEVLEIPAFGVRVLHEGHGETKVTAPLARGSIVVRFDSLMPWSILGAYLVVAFVGIGFAALVGSRIGTALSRDVELAERQISLMGAEDVVRGARVPRAPTFLPVHRLVEAIDRLGSIFREFAAAQERAISARRKAERMRGLFLASMSHDLKAPLNAVLGFAELVSRQPLTDGQRESLAIIEQRGRELLHLVRTILDSARVDAGELELAPERVRVSDVVTSAALDARELLHGGEVHIVAEVAPDMPRILVDPSRVAQALTLVLVSAARLGASDTVPVRASLPEGVARVRIDVEASGRALSAKDRDRLFFAFADAESARRHGSLGLGLSLARAIVEAHGGTLEVDSAEDSGTLFRLWLPTNMAP